METSGCLVLCAAWCNDAFFHLNQRWSWQWVCGEGGVFDKSWKILSVFRIKAVRVFFKICHTFEIGTIDIYFQSLFIRKCFKPKQTITWLWPREDLFFKYNTSLSCTAARSVASGNGPLMEKAVELQLDCVFWVWNWEILFTHKIMES